MTKFYQQRKYHVLFGTLVAIVLFSILFSKISSKLEIPQTLVKDIVEKTLTLIPDGEKKPILFEYIYVTDSCGYDYGGSCVNARSGPSVKNPIVLKLRKGMILKVEDTIKVGEMEWYKISFSEEWLRYPERVTTDLFVSADYVTSFFDEGNKELPLILDVSTKRIVVDRSEQVLYAYENDILFMKEKVSTGLELTPTPRGVFTIFKKSPSRYMQGPIPGISDHYYDLPGVPWNLYFTEQGAVIHGAYWHNNFGQPWSNGCVNVSIEDAEKLYKWADVGTEVMVRD